MLEQLIKDIDARHAVYDKQQLLNTLFEFSYSACEELSVPKSQETLMLFSAYKLRQIYNGVDGRYRKIEKCHGIKISFNVEAQSTAAHMEKESLRRYYEQHRRPH